MVRSPADFLSRRRMLREASTGFGLLALAGLTAEAASPSKKLIPRAKNVIFCYMSGGVSHVDSFDPKPRLARDHGKPLPMHVERTQFNNNGNLMASPWAFRHYGQSGLEISDLFPTLGAWCADDLAIVRSMTAKFSEHAQGNYFFHTGFPFMGYPSAGAWVTYGLGTENRNLPGFIVLKSGGSMAPHGGVGVYSSGYLPATFQASLVDVDADEPVLDVRPRVADASQRRELEFVAGLDRQFLDSLRGIDAPVEAAVRNYETAYRMQAAVPELVDLTGETTATKRLYGLDDPDPNTAAYARQCLLARRLVERGVRFVELTCLAYNIGGGNGPNPWDQHGDLRLGHAKMAHEVDRPIAALIRDLKARGLLDETLVIFAGEFGRTPFSQGGNGRDHNPYGFSIFLTGGGIKGGTVYGSTDEFGYKAVENPCDVYDLWATSLHLLGVDHESLTYRFGGRDMRLTDVHGNVLQALIG